MAEKKIYLAERDMPRQWYNIVADMPNKPLPPLHPGTRQPVGPEDLAPLFPMELIKQEVTTERYVDIPDRVREIYRLWRPTPLIRATALEAALDTPAKIYYKYEGASPSGSHKPNTAVAQAYYNAERASNASPPRPARDSGAPRCAWPAPSSGWNVIVYMVTHQLRSEALPPLDHARPSAPSHPQPRATAPRPGGVFLAENPDSSGSLGIAISEAVEARATGEPDTKYALGSVLNHVLMHQTVIGQEAMKQMEHGGRLPGCGHRLRWRRQQLRRPGVSVPARQLIGGKNARCVAVEPASCPKLTKGEFMLRFRRYRRLYPAAADVHAGPRFHARFHPCRGPALSRRQRYLQPAA